MQLQPIRTPQIVFRVRRLKSGCHVGRLTGINNRAKDWQMSSLRMSKQVTFSAVKKYRLQWNKQTIFIWMLESLKTVCVPPCITAHVSQIESLWEWKCWRQGFELGTTYSVLGEKVVCATISLYKFMHVMKHTNAPHWLGYPSSTCFSFCIENFVIVGIKVFYVN